MNGCSGRYGSRAAEQLAKELAALLDVTPETVSRWANREHPLDPRAVKLLGAMVLDSLGDRPTIPR